MHEDPLGLPWAASGDKQKPSLSRRGHRDIVSKLKARKAELEAYVAAYCDDDSDKKRLVPSAAPVPTPTKSNVNNKSFCPMPIKPLNQPTMEELRLQIEANRQREKFWTKVLVGSAVGGALYLAGPTVISYGATALSSVRGRGFSPSFGY